MTHMHYCEIGGHSWVCEGKALRTEAGDVVPSDCMCICGKSREDGDHSSCPVELVPCPDHLTEMTETQSTSSQAQHLAELFSRRDSFPDDSPERQKVAEQILSTILSGTASGSSPKPKE